MVLDIRYGLLNTPSSCGSLTPAAILPKSWGLEVDTDDACMVSFRMCGVWYYGAVLWMGECRWERHVSNICSVS